MAHLALISATAALVAGTAWWAGLVQEQLRDGPYMDEIFHIRQAQTYCAGRFSEWDPKITTPPGLYLASYLLSFITRDCHSPIALRGLNIAALIVVFLATYALLRTRLAVPVKARRPSETHTIITAFSVSLFPPLFFFSGLYYTDVLSTAIVLVHLYLSTEYASFVQASVNQESSSLLSIISRQISIVLTGVLAVLCRQTNIFWAAVFPAILTAVAVLKGAKPSPDQKDNHGEEADQTDQEPTWSDITSAHQQNLTVYDPPTTRAGLSSLPKFAVSASIAALNNPLRLLTSLLPFLTLVALFAAFVAHNGSVVLGDKSNHVATLHLTQMLYLGAYIAIFSLPVFLPLVFTALTNPLSFLPTARKDIILSLLLAVTGLAAILAAVHYNTIVHPFILADNRHLVFYVFRLFRVWPCLRYLAVLPYFGCMILCWKGFGWYQTLNRSPADVRFAQPLSIPVALSITAALSIVTAPLVEPRYFIIPWILWRASTSQTLSPSCSSFSHRQITTVLAMETVWFALINTTVGYMFLHRPFFWQHAPEEGLQRFLW